MTKAAVPLLLFGLAAVLRIHNAWVAPALSGFDGPYHAAYIGEIYWNGRFQLPHGFTNHPPLYYAVSAALWKLLPGSLSGPAVLFALRLVNVACGLALGGAVWASARRLFPGRWALACYALALALFLPMYIGPSALLGNQIMSSAFEAGTFALILRCLSDSRPSQALLAGLVGGLGILAKFSVGIVVGVGGLLLLARGWQLHGARPRALMLASALGVAALVTASPHFVRNFAYSEVPIDPSIDIWAGVDRSQGRGLRPWDAYADLDLGSLVQPGTFDADAKRAVWPVTFASTWFDLFGTVLDVHHPTAQRMARVLFAFGGIFVLAAGLGLVAARSRRIGSSVPLAVPALALLAVATLVSYVAFTRAVGTHAALKGTYLSPGFTAFALFAAMGLESAFARGRALRRASVALMAGFAACVVLIFWQGGLAPMRANPADFYMRDYSDPPTLRAFRFFVDREPLGRRPARASEPR
jgi:hypothetical protein